MRGTGQAITCTRQGSQTSSRARRSDIGREPPDEALRGPIALQQRTDGQLGHVAARWWEVVCNHTGPNAPEGKAWWMS
jgi:hypothetical protein